MKKVVITASATLVDEIDKWKGFFEEKGFDVLNYPKQINDDSFVEDFPVVHKEFYSTLNDTDVHFIANENKNDIDGYVGVGAFAEIAFSVGLKLTHDKDIRIVLYKMPSVDSLFYEDLKRWIGCGWVEIFDEDNL